MISNMLRFPSSLFDDLEDRFYPSFPAVPASMRRERAYPPVNMGVTETSVEVYVFAPGMKAEELDISLDKNLLSVSGERKSVASENSETASVYRQERYEGKFKRIITLPEDVDLENTEAVYRDGILHISIAKRTESKPRQIKVTV